MSTDDCYPYKDDEIRDITACVKRLLSKWLEDKEDRYRGSLIEGWSGDMMWQLWSMYGEQHHPLAHEIGLHREMLSPSQQAIVRTAIKQTIMRAG
jgi:hypothetical protein